MLRLSTVFLVWIASTACALEDTRANLEAELHEAYMSAWNESDERTRRLLAKSQRAWNEYRDANCALLGAECAALMAHERAAELRHLQRVLTESHGRTLLSTHARADGPD